MDDALEEVGGRGAGLVGLNPDDGLAAESSTAANSKSCRALRRAGRYFRSMWSSSPGRLFS